jgi:spore maturation protein CgeB
METVSRMTIPASRGPLRIFYASDTTPNQWFQSIRSNIWRNNLFAPLVDLGHDVIEFDHDLTHTFRNLDPNDPRHAAFIAENRPKVSAELFRQIQRAHAQKPIDLFFSYFYDACVSPSTIDAIRGLGIKTVNWFCNGSYQMHLIEQISPHYDFCLVPEKFRLQDYRAMGARPIYCQEAANPNVYHPCDVPQEFDVTFVGQAYGDRPLIIRYLLDNHINVNVWGHGWRNPHPRYLPKETFDAIASIPDSLRHDPLPDDELVKMFSRSRINLGFSTCGDTHLAERRILQVRLRDFEVPMSGGFYMVEHSEELGEFFDLEKEIIGYRDRQDLLAKIRHFLSHADQRERIRLAGLERARRDHTWQKRFQDAFAQMGFGGAP